MDRVVSLDHISKKFKIYRRGRDRLKDLLFPWSSPPCQEIWALKNISFHLHEGEVVGIIGQNGAGKSTLLQVICGILPFTEGKLKIKGSLSAILDLGVGFNPEFTGRENIFMSGALLGLTPKEVTDRLPGIASFSQIGEFLFYPVKTYSSGMFLRLAFAAAVNLIPPQVLVVDEVLAVGDLHFQSKCYRKIEELQKGGATILFVSHDLSVINQMCDRVILLEKGKIVSSGPPAEVTKIYLEKIFPKQDDHKPLPRAALLPSSEIVRNVKPAVSRSGNGKARIVGIKILDAGGKETNAISKDAKTTIRTWVEVYNHIEEAIVGIQINTAQQLVILSINTWEQYRSVELKAGGIYQVDFDCLLPPLKEDTYFITPALAEGNQINYQIIDWIYDLRSFQFKNDSPPGGMVAPLQLEIKLKEIITT